MGINGEKNFFPVRRQRTHSNSVFGLFEKRGDVQTLREKLREFKRVPSIENPDFDAYFAEKAPERREDGLVIHRKRGHSLGCGCAACWEEMTRPLAVEKPIREKRTSATYGEKMANLSRKMHREINEASALEPVVNIAPRVTHPKRCDCVDCRFAIRVKHGKHCKCEDCRKIIG